MPDTTKPNDGGLGNPAKRGRPRKIESDNGTPNGSSELAGGNAEPISRIESVASPSAGSGGYTPIDPIAVTAASGNNDNGDRPRRGRKPGGKNRPKEEAVSNLSALLKIERLLVTTCFFLGNIAECPELHLDEAEAAEISEALKELSKHYPIGMSEKKIAWINFSFAVGGVFGPKVVAIYKRPAKPRPQLAPTPIREAAPMEQGPYTNGLDATAPIITQTAPEAAKVPSEMWDQGGDIQDAE